MTEALDVKTLFDKLENYDFECTGGPLKNCIDWQTLRAEHDRLRELHTTTVKLAAQRGDKVQALQTEVNELRAENEQLKQGYPAVVEALRVLTSVQALRQALKTYFDALDEYQAAQNCPGMNGCDKEGKALQEAEDALRALTS